jgi:hypothetical protein
MIIKSQGHPKSILNKFDLLGNDENALSKAFAFMIGKEPDAFFAFIKNIGVDIRKTKKSFYDISIVTEKFSDQGRVDINIKLESKFHIIVESKIRGNRIRGQKSQYLSTFDQKCPVKILCLITQQQDINRGIIKGITLINISWFNIIEIYSDKRFSSNPLIQEFLHFTLKNYSMKDLKEILIQDLSWDAEIKRFKKYRIYRRDITFGSPMYFAPYFTSKARQNEGIGICYLSKILGILTLYPNDINIYREDLLRFCNDNKVVNNWINGVKKIPGKNQPLTFYFLDEPLRLRRNLLKEKPKIKGWIATRIPKNRCVTFNEFSKRLMA